MLGDRYRNEDESPVETTKQQWDGGVFAFTQLSDEERDKYE